MMLKQAILLLFCPGCARFCEASTEHGCTLQR